MCNILILEPGQMIEKEKFFNMCYNNWHSWGMVTVVGDKLDVQRHVPEDEDGEIDPQEVWDAVEKDIEYTRYLHVRHTTAGLTDLSNCHPMDVYYDPKSGRQVLFMHNGTHPRFKSRKFDAKTQKWEDDDSGPSDTKNFVDQILIPYVAQADFGYGKGDISSAPIRKLMGEFWYSNNRGLVISSDQGYVLLGKTEWKKIKDVDGGEVLSANDLYFDKVVRGPEKERRDREEQVRLRLDRERQEEARKEREKEAKASGTSEYPARVKLSEVQQRARHPFFDLSEDVSNILEDYDFYGDLHAQASLAFLTQEELEKLYEDRDTFIWMFDFLAQQFALLVDEHEETLQKKERGELLIAEMKKELSESRSQKSTKKPVEEHSEKKAA